VLTFALKTAEQSLADIQPQLVTKLTEGRAKRIKGIETSYKGKLKDVEQRSSETNIGNSMQLEQFQQKAMANTKNTEDMTKQAIEKLFALLQISNNGGSATVPKK